MTRVFAILTTVAVGLAAAPAADPAPFPPPKTLGPVETYGANIQRTMSLLASSTPAKRNTVRVLFYGQSITEQEWTKAVAADLKARFPNADLVIENRAIGGHSSQRLVKTAEADLYPFAPDLVIFHVYGAHTDYETIVRRVRERTTAEILHTTDHLNARDTADEPTGPAGLTSAQWGPWFNAVFLPGVAKKYDTELADVRGLWKQYVRDYGLEPQALLKDGVHLNDRGNFVMAEIVKAYLRHDDKLGDGYADLVKTYVVGKDVNLKDGVLHLDFDGNRVDLIAGPKADSTGSVPGPLTEIRIDGKRPTEFPGVYAFTRTTAYPRSNWPCLLRVQSAAPRVVEDWTLTITEISPDLKTFRFDLAGSVTGPDGSGEGGKRFVSKSGRVVIDPDDWNFDYCLQVFKRPIAAPFVVRWKCVAHAANGFDPRPAGPGVESAVTVARGIPNGKHRLEVTGVADGQIAAVRVYRPAVAAKD